MKQILCGLAFLVVGFAVTTARADAQTQTFAVSYESISNNCMDTGLSLKQSPVALSINGSKLSIEIPMIPILKGNYTAKSGKFRGEAKRGKIAIEGLEGRFSMAGHVDKDGIDLVFIAEYYKGGKPLCTQSWNGKGKEAQ